MKIGRDIYNGLIRHIESEIQAGRRHAALDEKLVAEFLALKVDSPAPQAGPGAKPARSVQPPTIVSAPASATPARALAPATAPAPAAADFATLDDIAFALLSAEAEFNAVGDRLHALRKLYNLARQAGALGADRVVEAVSHAGGR